MDSDIGFIFKIVLASLVLSALIKYGGQLLTVNPTNNIALIIVLFPSVVLILLFGLRFSNFWQA